METSLYPLKFEPILKDKIWGGTRLKTMLYKEISPANCCGESWEVSGLVGDESMITNGFLAENNLNELLEIYMTELVGEKNYEKYGLGFPLLIKFIDAQDNLSVQVHPDDELAQRKYGQSGKTEMWHVIASEPGSGLYVGFNKTVSKAQFEEAIANGTVEEVLQFYPVQPGDTFMIPAGTVHAIGKGVLLAEIQQPSDITFRVFDWNRLDDEGNSRELHVQEALEAIDFDHQTDNFKVEYQPQLNKTVRLVRSQYFNTSLLEFDQPLNKSFVEIDSFVIYMCLDGQILLAYGDERERLETGEVVLIPAEMEEVQLLPARKSKVLEVYC
ncbi:MAG: class I mannose-6-phosphate isomerase [Bacteroidales bacterium]|jgi:mannose-6-phosphate isomerase|nr:class I mannose-6-phosphate isomerase [Bacteroidales bacterium]